MERCGAILGFAGLAYRPAGTGTRRVRAHGVHGRWSWAERKTSLRSRPSSAYPRLELAPGSAFAFAAAHGETDVHGHRRDWTNPSDQKSGDADAAGDLSVALPIGVLAGDPGVVLRRLDIPLGVNGARGDGVLARGRVGPLQRPQLPGKLGILALVDG